MPAGVVSKKSRLHLCDAYWVRVSVWAQANVRDAGMSFMLLHRTLNTHALPKHQMMRLKVTLSVEMLLRICCKSGMESDTFFGSTDTTRFCACCIDVGLQSCRSARLFGLEL